jgi:hypothetical protein
MVNQSFPWFDDMLLVLGDTLATGRYSLHGSIQPLNVEDDETEDSNIDPQILQSQYSPVTPATQLDTS